MFVSLSVCMSHACLWKAGEGTGSPTDGVTSCGEPPSMDDKLVVRIASVLKQRASLQPLNTSNLTF